MRPPLNLYKKGVFGEDAATDVDSELLDFISSALQSKPTSEVSEPQQTTNAVSPNVSSNTESLDLGKINNLLSMYGENLTKQKGLDDTRYKNIEDKVNQQRSFDLSPEKYDEVNKNANAARIIADIFQAANLGGNGAAFQNIGQHNYEAAMEPIAKSKYFQDALKGQAKEQIDLGSLQRQNLKDFGGDIENLLQSAKPYEALKIDRDKADPNSNISMAKLSSLMEKANRYKNQLAGQRGESYVNFSTKQIPDFLRRMGVDDVGKINPTLNFNQLDALDKEIDSAYNVAKGLEGQEIQKKFASAAGMRAASGAEPKAAEVKMIDDVNKLQASIEGLEEIAKIKKNVKTGKIEGGTQRFNEFFGLSGDSGMDNLKAAVARIFNKETHEISGAAVSPSEWSRIAPQIPDASDPDERFISKLNGAMKDIRRILGSRISTYEAYKRGGYTPADLGNIRNKVSVQSSPSLSESDQEALEWANSNPNDARAADIKKRLGVK